MNTSIIHEALRCYFDPSNRFRREVSLFWTKETGVLSMTTNNEGGVVDFDWFEIWENGFKRAKPYPELAFMLHTHPPGCDSMSGVDYNMVYGWQTALDVPIYFVVVLRDKCRAYLCDRDEQDNYGVHDLGFIQHADCSAYEQLEVYLLNGLSMRESAIVSAELDEAVDSLNRSLKLYGGPHCLPTSFMELSSAGSSTPTASSAE